MNNESRAERITPSGYHPVSDPPIPMNPPAPQDPNSWFCPYCGMANPPISVLINTPVPIMGIGVVQTAMLVCLAKTGQKDSEGGDILCRRLVTAQVVHFVTEQDMSKLAQIPRRRSPLEM